MERIELPETILEQSLVETILSKFLLEIEERITNPEPTNTDFTANEYEKLKSGNSIKMTPERRSLLIRVCQDFKLTPEEIDFVVGKFLNE